MPLYESLTSTSTPEQIAAAYSEFAGGAGGNTAANQGEAVNYLQNLGVAAPTVNQAYTSYLTNAPLYQGLTAQSTPDQIADAYRQFTQNNGGDNQATQAEATKYLGQIGVANTNTQDAYQNYLDQESAASNLYTQFGVADGSAAPTTEGILAGFKYAKDSGLDENTLKDTLGQDAFNKYKTGFADYAKTGIAGILADKKLSFDEAKEVVKFGRDYGYDSQQLADMTGQKKELFDTVSKTYDDATKTIVSNVFGSEDAKTDGDKIVRAIALQEKYGFTDEDLAKATDLTTEQVKNYLEPVKKYESEYRSTLEKPDVSGKEILDFLEKSKKNEGVSTAFGSNIDTQIARLNELNEKWSGFKDGYQAENIYNQVNKITEAAGGKNWSGDWMSGGDNAAKETVRVLLDKGVDNLIDLGVEKNYKQTSADAEFYNGQRVQKDEDGRKYVLTPISSGDSEYSYPTYLSADAQTTPGRVLAGGSGEDGHTYFAPLTEEELKTYDPKTNSFEEAAGNKLIDKSTGKTISTSNDNKFTLDSYNTGNFFAGRSKQMGIMMTDQGVPVPYQTSQREGFKYSPAFPIALALLAPYAASYVGGALPGAATAATGAAEGAFLAGTGSTLANTALTQGIMGAGTAALTGQDILKGALMGGVGAPVSAGIGSILPAGMDPAIARAVTNAGAGVAKGALQGQNFNDLLGEGVLSGLTNYGIGEATKGFGNTFNLTPQQLNFATGIAAPLLQNKSINPISLISSLANTGTKQNQRTTP
jgi:hypothetical protein